MKRKQRLCVTFIQWIWTTNIVDPVVENSLEGAEASEAQLDSNREQLGATKGIMEYWKRSRPVTDKWVHGILMQL